MGVCIGNPFIALNTDDRTTATLLVLLVIVNVAIRPLIQAVVGTRFGSVVLGELRISPSNGKEAVMVSIVIVLFRAEKDYEDGYLPVSALSALNLAIMLVSETFV